MATPVRHNLFRPVLEAYWIHGIGIKDILDGEGSGALGKWKAHWPHERQVSYRYSFWKDGIPPWKKPPMRVATGARAQIRAHLLLTGAVRFEDLPHINQVTFKTAISDLRSNRYCGRGEEPLNISYAKGVWRLVLSQVML